MKSLFLQKTIMFAQQYHNFSSEQLEKIRYGLEGIYLTFTKMIVLVFFAIVLGILKEFIIVLILFNIIRYTGFGFHAEKSYQCLFLSLLYFIGIPILFMKITLSSFQTFLICTFCIFSYFLFAPADTIKRPLPNMKKRKIRKWVTVGIGVIYSLCIFIFPNSGLNPLLLSVLVIQAIIIQPALYKLFKQPYNNYKNYNKALNTSSI